MRSSPKRSPGAVAAATGAKGRFVSTDEYKFTGPRQIRQYAAVIALSVGELPEVDRDFCRRAMFAPSLAAHEARRLNGIVARQCRAVGL
jgi:hypothetical protein